MPLATALPEEELEQEDIVDEPVAEPASPPPASLSASEPDDDLPVPPVQPPGQAAPASTQTHQSILDRIQALTGQDLSAKYRTEEDALRGLVHAQQRLSQRDEMASLGQYMAPHYDEFQKFLELKQQYAQRQGQGQPQQPAQPENWWNPPQWDERWTRYLMKDPATGDTTLDPKTPHDVARKIESWQEYHESWLNKFRTNPAEALSGFQQQIQRETLNQVRNDHGLRRTVLQDVYNLLNTWDQQKASQNTAHQIVGQNQEWLYQRNKNNQVMYEPDGYGRQLPVYTPQGALYVQEVAALTQQGIADPVTLDKYARMAVKEKYGALVPKGQKPPAAAPAEPQVPAGAREMPQASVSTPAKPRQSQKGMSLREMLDANLNQFDPAEFDVVDA